MITAGVLHRNVINTSSSTRTGPMSGLRHGARLRRGGPTRASGTGMMTGIRSINDKGRPSEVVFCLSRLVVAAERAEALPRNRPDNNGIWRVINSSVFMVASTATTLYLQPAPAPTEYHALLVLADDAEPEHIGPSFLRRALGEPA